MTLIIDTTRISQFQEYFAARALCEAGTVLSGSPPWKWPVWWSNALSLGAEMGDDFRRGLLRAAVRVAGDTLDLSSGQLDGQDRKTTLRVVTELMPVLKGITLSKNDIQDEGAIAISESLMTNKTLETLRLVECGIGLAGGIALASALEVNPVLTSLSLADNNLTGREQYIRPTEIQGKSMVVGAKVIYRGRERTILRIHRGYNTDEIRRLELEFDLSGIEAIAAALAGSSVALKKLLLGENSIGDQGAIALSQSLQNNTTLEELALNSNGICVEGVKALASALGTSTVLASLDISSNSIGSPDESGIQAIAVALAGSSVMTACTLIKNDLDIESAKMLAKIGTEKGIMLSGMKRDQTKASFRQRGLKSADGILIASDLPFMAVLTTIECAFRAQNSALKHANCASTSAHTGVYNCPKPPNHRFCPMRPVFRVMAVGGWFWGACLLGVIVHTPPFPDNHPPSTFPDTDQTDPMTSPLPLAVCDSTASTMTPSQSWSAPPSSAPPRSSSSSEAVVKAECP